ncbi:MAG TPA: hypothetical protein VFJ85_00520, partial [Acidimicrobiales bacterium]|nr:hypothetical protein [Acidimicrobiales bacterium]
PQVPDLARFADALARHGVDCNSDGIAMRVADLDDVIASKQWADRPKDRAALEELRTLRRGDGGSDS